MTYPVYNPAHKCAPRAAARQLRYNWASVELQQALTDAEDSDYNTLPLYEKDLQKWLAGGQLGKAAGGVIALAARTVAINQAKRKNIPVSSELYGYVLEETMESLKKRCVPTGDPFHNHRSLAVTAAYYACLTFFGKQRRRIVSGDDYRLGLRDCLEVAPMPSPDGPRLGEKALAFGYAVDNLELHCNTTDYAENLVKALVGENGPVDSVYRRLSRKFKVSLPDLRADFWKVGELLQEHTSRTLSSPFLTDPAKSTEQQEQTNA